MSLLSPHLASPAQASNFLWLAAGLPSMWESSVDNKPHLGGIWVPEHPPAPTPAPQFLLQAFEESRVHPCSVWRAPIVASTSVLY